MFPKFRVVFDRSFYGIIIQLRFKIRLVTLKNFEKNVNYINQLFKDNGDLKYWKQYKRCFTLMITLYKWLQFPHVWKHILKQNFDISQNLIYLNHYVIKTIVW